MSTLTFYVRFEPELSERSDELCTKAMQAIARSITDIPEKEHVCGWMTTKTFREWSCAISVDAIPHQWLRDANLLAQKSPIMYGYSWSGSVLSTAKGVIAQTDLAETLLEWIRLNREQVQEMSSEGVTSTLAMFMNDTENLCLEYMKDKQP